MDDNGKFIKGWGEKRKKGKLQYINICTVKYFIIMSLGVAVVALLLVIGLSIYTKSNRFDVIFNAHVIKKTILNITAFLTGSIIHSILGWKNNENKYNELIKTNNLILLMITLLIILLCL